MVKRYSTLFELKEDFKLSVSCFIANEKFIKKWNELSKNWKKVKDHSWLPTRSLREAITVLLGHVVKIRKTGRFRKPLPKSYVWAVTEKGAFPKEVLERAFIAWEQAMIQEGMLEVKLWESLEDLQIENKVITYGNFELSPSGGLIPNQRWVYDALPISIAKNLTKEPLILGNNIKTNLKITSEGNLLNWEDPLEEITVDGKKYMAFHKFKIQLLNYPAITKVFFKVESSLVRVFRHPEKKSFFMNRSVLIDFCEYVDEYKNRDIPILQPEILKGKTPKWHYLEREVFRNLTIDQFPDVNSLLPMKKPLKALRIVHSSKDNYYRIGKGTGIYNKGLIAFHVLKTIKSAKIVQFKKFSRGIPVVNQKNTTWYKECDLKEVFMLDKEDRIILFVLYQNHTKAYKQLFQVIKKIIEYFGFEIADIEDQISLGRINLDYIEIRLIKFPEEKDTGLFQTKYKGNIQDAREILDKKMNLDDIDNNIKVALVETNWSGRKVSKGTDSKALLREILAEKDITTQFFQIKNDKKSLSKEEINHTISELFRLSGLSINKLDIPNINPKTWIIGIFVKKNKYNQWTGSLVATKGNSGEFIGCYLFGEWKDLHEGTVDVMKNPYRKKNEEIIKKNIIDRLKELAVANRTINNKFNAIIYINGIPTRRIWKNLSTNKASLDDPNIFESSLLKECALIRVIHQIREIPRIFSLKVKEDPNDNSKATDKIDIKEFYSLIKKKKVSFALGNTFVYMDDGRDLDSQRIMFYEREEPVAQRKTRESEKFSRYSSKIDNRKDFFTSIPVEFFLINKGVWSNKDLLRKTGYLCRFSPYGTTYQSFPLPLHLAKNMVMDRPRKTYLESK
jgi:hypothetical protein